MKFEDGETVVLYKPGHQWHLMNFKAYPSVHTPDAYRLKYGSREILVDVSEIRSMAQHNNLLMDHDLKLDEYCDLSVQTGIEELKKRVVKRLSNTLNLETAQGDELEYIGNMVGISRYNVDALLETDVDYRERIREKFRSDLS